MPELPSHVRFMNTLPWKNPLSLCVNTQDIRPAALMTVAPPTPLAAGSPTMFVKVGRYTVDLNRYVPAGKKNVMVLPPVFSASMIS